MTTRAGPPNQLITDGKIINTPAGLASTLNRFFINKIKNLIKGIPKTDSDPLRKLKETMRNRECSFKLREITLEEGMKLILSSKNSTATGVDHIDNRTLKLVAKEIAPAITKIINLSFRTSTFPKIYKQSKIIPLLKPEKPAIECSSYRPVNQLVSLSKMVEREAFGQLVSYLEENKLFHPNQHGGRKGHSTATALIQMHDQWIEDMEAGKIIGVTFYDQSAAFDVCSHSILIEKLKLLGLEETSLDWMKNYLSDRSQSVLVDGYLSAPIDLPPCSVVQEEVGSRILYL